MSKKEKTVTCPICGKPVKISEQMVSFESLEEIENVKAELNKLQELTDNIIEIIHHNPKLEKHANRLAIFYIVIEKLVSNVILSNAEKCGILDLCKNNVLNNVQKIIEEQGKIEIKKHGEYVR